jgi:hypothetical protein
MPRIDPAKQESHVRISTLAAEIYRAIGVVLEGDENLTHEEICLALNNVMARELVHLWSGTDDPA